MLSISPPSSADFSHDSTVASTPLRHSSRGSAPPEPSPPSAAGRLVICRRMASAPSNHCLYRTWGSAWLPPAPCCSTSAHTLVPASNHRLQSSAGSMTVPSCLSSAKPHTSSPIQKRGALCPLASGTHYGVFDANYTSKVNLYDADI